MVDEFWLCDFLVIHSGIKKMWWWNLIILVCKDWFSKTFLRFLNHLAISNHIVQYVYVLASMIVIKMFCLSVLEKLALFKWYLLSDILA